MDSFDAITRQGAAISSLFVMELSVSLLLLALVVGVLVVAVARSGRLPDDGSEPRQVHGNRRLEVVWTVTPALVLAVFFGLMVQTMRAVTAAEPTGMPLRIIGHQWWWEYQFSDGQVITANELHLPVGTPVQATLESVDVIHSFHVPQFGWMRDNVPGKTNAMQLFVERPGTYDGTCNQYCGLQHAWMLVVVDAQPADQFNAWLQQQRQPVVASGARGEQVFVQNTCINCHTIRGLAEQAHVGPDLTHLGSRRTLGTGVIANTPDGLRRWIRNAGQIKPGVLMPAFPNLSEADLGALADYLATLN